MLLFFPLYLFTVFIFYDYTIFKERIEIFAPTLTQSTNISFNSFNSSQQPGSAEDEVDAYLRHALMSQNHDPTTRGQILCKYIYISFVMFRCVAFTEPCCSLTHFTFLLPEPTALVFSCYDSGAVSQSSQQAQRSVK